MYAQKKGKGKENPEVNNYDSLATAPVNKKSSKKDSRKDKKESLLSTVNYTPEVVIPVADSSKKFSGIIKYLITSDDPADKDSVFIIFGENKIRVTMFIPGYRVDQLFEKNMIVSFRDSTFLELDLKNKTYKTEKLGARNEGTEFSLIPSKKTGKVMSFTCDEYKGEMTTNEGDIFEASCLTSNQHTYISVMDYNFMNIQPLVIGYRIVLGFRTKSKENENTYIMAYKIEPLNTDTYFDLSTYKSK
jgi:hypothetical protein